MSKDKVKHCVFPRCFSFRAKIAVGFAIIAMLSTIIGLVTFSVVWNNTFKQYALDNLNNTATFLCNEISEDYAQSGQFDNNALVSLMHYNGPEQDINICVYDVNENLVYDSSRRNFLLDTRNNQIEGGATQGAAPMREEQSISKDIYCNDVKIGTLTLWTSGKESVLSKQDLEFRESIFSSVLLAGVLMLAISVFAGLIFSNSLFRPIKHISKVANRIKEGDLSARTGLKGNDEIADLGKSFDEMADSFEIAHEHEKRVTSDVAHELRTPLMAMQATVEAMIDGVYEATPERLELINSEVRRLSKMVSRLLELSKLENRIKKPNLETFDVEEKLKMVYELNKTFLKEKNMEFVFNSEGPIEIESDQELVQQAVSNLISNAARYTDEGGAITLSLSKIDDKLQISVADTGIGLDEDEIKMVFDRFWRAHESRERDKGGLGIGLSIVQEIAKSLGGSVSATGEKGKGACFNIYLPLK